MKKLEKRRGKNIINTKLEAYACNNCANCAPCSIGNDMFVPLNLNANNKGETPATFIK